MAKRVRGQPLRHDEFVFYVRRPSLRYGFRLQHEKWIDDPYDESLSLQFVAECIYPDRFKDREAAGLFFAREGLEAGAALRRRPNEATFGAPKTEPPKAVGSITARGAEFEVSGFLPPQACWHLASAIQAGVITSMLANAFWVGRGLAHLNSISFLGPEFDAVAYVG